MRPTGSDHPKSRWIKAHNPEINVTFEVRGVRAVTAAIWGKTPAGIPRKVSSVISICNGSDKRDHLHGWYFSYINGPSNNRGVGVEEPRDILAELGI